jgi:protein-L-isoaspartate(D-aspartate) O-methyltransferase
MATKVKAQPKKDVKKPKASAKTSEKGLKIKPAKLKEPILKGNPSDSRSTFFRTLRSEGIREDIIEAFENVEPALFFDARNHTVFYTSQPVQIAHGQTGDVFLNLARMINHLNPKKGQVILEIGTGSGYSTAILSLLCKEVITVDIVEELAVAAKKRLYDNDFGNIRFYAGDGTDLENEYGKIDGAIIHAACRKRPLALLEQMTPGGVAVYPMGPAHMHQITVMTNREDLVKGERFAMKFYEQGHFSLIEGIFGYKESEGANPWGEEGEEDPPKAIDSNPFLFQPPQED